MWLHVVEARLSFRQCQYAVTSLCYSGQTFKPSAWGNLCVFYFHLPLGLWVRKANFFFLCLPWLTAIRFGKYSTDWFCIMVSMVVAPDSNAMNAYFPCQISSQSHHMSWALVCYANEVYSFEIQYILWFTVLSVFSSRRQRTKPITHDQFLKHKFGKFR